MLKKILKWTGSVIGVLIVIIGGLYLIYLQPVLSKMMKTEVVQYDKDLTLVLGGGGNSGVLVSDSLVLVIDTKMGDAAEEFSKKVRELAGSKPILVVNTHNHVDHSSGNRFYQDQRIIAGGNYTKEIWLEEANEQTMPTDWLKETLHIKMNDDTATIFNLTKNTHTASDVMVYLHRRKMLFGGDVLLNKQVPSVQGHADPNNYIKTFEELPKQFDIQKIVPGHGQVGGLEIIEAFNQYFADMKTAAHDDSKKKELVAKYKDWTQVPVLMSSEATIKFIKEKGE